MYCCLFPTIKGYFLCYVEKNNWYKSQPKHITFIIFHQNLIIKVKVLIGSSASSQRKITEKAGMMLTQILVSVTTFNGKSTEQNYSPWCACLSCILHVPNWWWAKLINQTNFGVVFHPILIGIEEIDDYLLTVCLQFFELYQSIGWELSSLKSDSLLVQQTAH